MQENYYHNNKNPNSSLFLFGKHLQTPPARVELASFPYERKALSIMLQGRFSFKKFIS